MHETTTSTKQQNGGLIRLGGLTVILGLLIHIILNGAIKKFPPQSPSLIELQAYLSAEANTWAIVHGLKYVALVGLVFFAAGLFTRTCCTHRRQAVGWGILGLLGSAIHVTNAMIANGIEILAFFDFDRLSEDPTLFWLLFHLARVLFTAEIVAWGLVIFGFSMAGSKSVTLPKWITGLGFFSAALCLVSVVFVVSVLTDGWATMLMDVAAVTGLVWFASVGVYMMMRGSS
jgi:hypothetical protein